MTFTIVEYFSMYEWLSPNSGTRGHVRLMEDAHSGDRVRGHLGSVPWQDAPPHAGRKAGAAVCGGYRHHHRRARGDIMEKQKQRCHTQVWHGFTPRWTEQSRNNRWCPSDYQEAWDPEQFTVASQVRHTKYCIKCLVKVKYLVPVRKKRKIKCSQLMCV